MKNGWQAAVDRFAAQLDADEKSPLTVRNYRRELRAFADWYHASYREPPGLGDVAHEDLREYKDSLRARKLEPATINLALAACGSFLKWALASKLIREPVPTPKTARQVQRVPRWLTRVQERRLVKVVRQAGVKSHLGLVEAFLVFGLRISEMAALEWGDVAMGRSEAVLKVRKGKGSKQRDLPFGGNQRARDALDPPGVEGVGQGQGAARLPGPARAAVGLGPQAAPLALRPGRGDRRVLGARAEAHLRQADAGAEAAGRHPDHRAVDGACLAQHHVPVHPPQPGRAGDRRRRRGWRVGRRRGRVTLQSGNMRIRGMLPLIPAYARHIIRVWR